MTRAEQDAWHADLRAKSHAALHSPEFRSVLDDLKARCEAHRVTPRRPPARPDDEAFDAALDRAEGGPDICKPLYGSL